ncbi:MAG: hypothetical protein Fur0037_07940 [Planctomycetota bacterium]
MGMRCVLILLALLLSASPGYAQERIASLILEDGSSVTGRVVRMDLDHLTVEVDGRERTFAVGQLRQCRIERVEEPDLPGGEQGPAQSAPLPQPLEGSLLGARLRDLDRRYPWLSPTQPAQWVSLGVMLFVFASFAFFFSTQLVGSEVGSFARAVGCSVLGMLVAAVEVAIVPSSPPILAAVLVADLLLLLPVLRVSFELSLGSALLAVLFLLIFAGAAFGILEAVDKILLSMGTPAT